MERLIEAVEAKTRADLEAYKGLGTEVMKCDYYSLIYELD